MHNAPMKPLSILLAGLLLVSCNGAFAQSSQQLSNEAQRAYLSGDVDTAKQKFKMLLEIDPSNTLARNYLRMIDASENKDGGGQMEKQLKNLVLPKVEFREATFGSALEYMRKLAAKQSDGKVNVSFVVQLPPDFEETRKVTLNVGPIPFSEALRYLCDLAGVDFKVEKFAIIIRKKAGEETSSSHSSSSFSTSSTATQTTAH